MTILFVVGAGLYFDLPAGYWIAGAVCAMLDLNGARP